MGAALKCCGTEGETKKRPPMVDISIQAITDINENNINENSTKMKDLQLEIDDYKKQIKDLGEEQSKGGGGGDSNENTEKLEQEIKKLQKTQKDTGTKINNLKDSLGDVQKKMEFYKMLQEKQFLINSVNDIDEQSQHTRILIKELPEEDVEQLLETLGQQENLKDLQINLTDTYYDDKAIYNKICENLQQFTGLYVLNLNFDQCYIEEDTFNVLGTSLEALNGLVYLDINFVISESNFTDVCAKVLAKALAEMINLIDLKLDFATQKIQQDGACEISDSINGMKFLEKLSLNYKKNEIQAQGATTIIQNLENCENLEQFYLNIHTEEKYYRINPQEFDQMIEFINLDSIKKIQFFHIVLNAHDVSSRNLFALMDKFRDIKVENKKFQAKLEFNNGKFDESVQNDMYEKWKERFNERDLLFL